MELETSQQQQLHSRCGTVQILKNESMEEQGNQRQLAEKAGQVSRKLEKVQYAMNSLVCSTFPSHKLIKVWSDFMSFDPGIFSSHMFGCLADMLVVLYGGYQGHYF